MQDRDGKDADISAGKLFRRRTLQTGFISIKGQDTGNGILRKSGRCWASGPFQVIRGLMSPLSR